MKEEVNELFVACSCRSEVLLIEYQEEYHDWNLAMYQSGVGNNNKLKFRERIRWAWNLLRTGKPFTDEVIFQREDIERIVSFLNKTIKKSLAYKCKSENCTNKKEV